MASLAELQDALTNAHNAGDTEAATVLANEIIRQRMPWAAPSGNPAPIPEGPLSSLPSSAQAGIIGAGRVGNQIEAGTKQALLSGLAIGQDTVGVDPKSTLQKLSTLDKIQQSDQPVYDALKKQYPIATGVGEALPTLAVPVGQATTAARILAPAVGMAGINALQYGGPLERFMRGASGFATGLAGGGLGEGMARVIQPVRNAMDTPAQVAAKSASATIGAPLLPSQQTGSPTLALIEDSLARSPGSAGVIGDVLGRQKAAVGRATASAINQPGDVVTQDVVDAAKKAMGGEYDKFRAQIPGGMPVDQNVLDAVNTAYTKLQQGSKQGVGKAEAISMLDELKDKLYSSKALSPEDYSGWVSDLSAKARQIQNPQVAAQLKSVGAAMDASARGPLNPAWRQLDQAYAAARTLEKSKAYNPETGDVLPLTLANYMRAHPSGANATSLADVAAYGKAVPQLRAGSPTFERGQVSPMGLVNMLWRYPLAKFLTSDAMREYLAKGLFASPEASGLLANVAAKGALPLSALPTTSLLSPAYNYQ